MFFIAAPFGNYLKYKNVISVSGTWTLESRPGRFSQILKTLRYTKRGWVNKLGLRNKGIDFGLRQRYDLLNIAAINHDDWKKLYEKIPRDSNVEINLGCPNIKPNMWTGFESFTKDNRKWCIAKIPPTFSKQQIDFVIESGFNQIHACNTIPIDRGGLSGKEIIPYTIKILEHIKKNYPRISVIAGGGIMDREVVNKYRSHGADHFSLGSVCFTPWKIKKIIK